MNKILLILFPIFFSLPDLGFNIGPVNLRINDLNIYLLFLLNINNLGSYISFLFNSRIYRYQIILLFFAFLSFSFVIINSNYSLISSYEFIRSVGSLPFLIILPFLLNNKKNRDYLYFGAIFGSVIYILSIYYNYQSILIEGELIKNYSSFKSSISFLTLNPNSVSSISIIFFGINMLSFFENKNKHSLFLGLIMFLIPFLVFSRAMIIGLIFGVIFFLLLYNFRLLKNTKPANLLFMCFVFLISFFLFNKFLNFNFLIEAFDIDFYSGLGFSGRYELWRQGLDLIKISPIFGNGFCTNHGLYMKYFYGNMSHNIYLHYWIELGIIGLLIFIMFTYDLIINRFRLFKETNNVIFLFQVSFFISFLIADLSSQLLYVNKYAYCIYTLSLLSITE